MTETEAREILDEIRSVRPRKRYGQTLYELRPDGRLDVYRLNKKRTRSVFMHTDTPSESVYVHEVRDWLVGRGVKVWRPAA